MKVIALASGAQSRGRRDTAGNSATPRARRRAGSFASLPYDSFAIDLPVPSWRVGDGDEILCLNGIDVKIIRREREKMSRTACYGSACGLCPRLTRLSDYREASAVATALMLMSTLDPRIG